MDLCLLPTFADGAVFHVVVESPRGSPLKLKFDARLGAMSVSRPLPVGVFFSFDCGFMATALIRECHAPEKP